MRSLVIIMHVPDQRHTLHFILSVLQGIVRLFLLFFSYHGMDQTMIWKEIALDSD